MTINIKKGTLVKSVTIDFTNKTEKTLDFGPIIFDYNFKESELVNSNDGVSLFQRTSEDNKIHQYFVKGI